MTPSAGAPGDPSEGYVTEIAYMSDYHGRTNPLFMRLALLKAGIVPPPIAIACDLGFGQGVSLAIHAASGPVHWIGNDLNPVHVAHARRLVDAAGVSAELHQETFLEFAEREDLPDVDYVVAHGLWSWVSDRNRAAILRFVAHKLKPGGVLFLSYNALPGQAMIEPLRHLAVEIARRGETGPSLAERITAAIAAVGRLAAVQPDTFRALPRVAATLKDIAEASPRYLAHEYFNRDWRPMHFADVASTLAEAGLTWAGRANYAGPIEDLELTPAQRALLDETTDPLLRETVRDFLVDRSFRHDYWVKQPAVDPAAAGQQLREECFVLTGDQAILPLPLRGALVLGGRASLERTATALLAGLADGRVRRLGEIETATVAAAPAAERMEALELLIDSKLVAHAQPDPVAAAARPAAHRLNAFVLREAAAGGKVRALASPVLGGGIGMSREEQAQMRDGTLPAARLERLRALGAA